MPGCWDTGILGCAPCQDLGPPPKCPSPAPGQQFSASLHRAVFLAESAFFSLCLTWHPGISLPCPGPVLPLSKHPYQLSTRQFPLCTLLAGGEGHAAMRHLQMFAPLLSLLFYSPQQQQRHSGAEPSLFDPRSSYPFAAKTSSSGSTGSKERSLFLEMPFQHPPAPWGNAQHRAAGRHGWEEEVPRVVLALQHLRDATTTIPQAHF